MMLRPQLPKLILIAFGFAFGYGSVYGEAKVVVGSKKFTESVILGEIIRGLFQQANVTIEHKQELGATRVVWNALRRGDVHIYPDYTGTLTHEIFAQENLKSFEDLIATLDKIDLAITEPLGFNNTYVIGMPEQKAADLGIKTIADLTKHPTLRFGFSSQFLDRKDGWPGLRQRYRLPQAEVTGMDHDLAYRGLASGDIDITDLYSTDAEIEYYKLRSLQDNLNYFPEYRALYVYRKSLARDFPEVLANIRRIKIGQNQMIKMNAAAKIDRQSEAAVAQNYLQKTFGMTATTHQTQPTSPLIKNTLAHLELVCISLTAAILLAIPLGIVAAKSQVFGPFILGVVGVVQTIPSLALLVFMIPFLGIGGPPAMFALFLYSLLPIVRNTAVGITTIPLPLRESAIVLGLSPRARLLRVELPLAAPAILAGIKTSAIINIGTATLGALIGAGGYGQPILTGIRRDDIGLILQGAIPAALMALTAQGIFALSEKYLVPKGLRTSN